MQNQKYLERWKTGENPSKTKLWKCGIVSTALNLFLYNMDCLVQNRSIVHVDSAFHLAINALNLVSSLYIAP